MLGGGTDGFKTRVRLRRVAMMSDLNAQGKMVTKSVHRTWADQLGIGLSGLCLVHCLLTPLVIILIPAIEVSVYHEMFHRSLLMVLPLIALGAFIPGYRRHGQLSVFLWSIPGLALIALGALAFENNLWLQTLTSIAGSALLIRAHFINHGLRANCAHANCKP
jgi:hypothetical protein